MQYQNRISFLVSGRNALFTDPITKLGGEKCSYQIPTYQALKGILESVYWKPTFIWVIDRVRVLHKIRSQSKGIRPINYDGGNTLSIYTYLTDVAYQVEAHFIWNENRPELGGDRNENKHYFIAKRMIERGGRRDIFLGTRECQGYVVPSVFGEGAGEYDASGEMAFGLQFHGFSYPDENGTGELEARFWNPRMVDGVVEFCPPEQCPVIRSIKKKDIKTFTEGLNFSSCDPLFSELSSEEVKA
jgi:CRISPR-associated protein Cas5d